VEVSLTRTIAVIRQAVASVVWLVAVLAIAFGSAGVVAGLDTPAADGSDRTGRTAQGDAAVDRALLPIEEQLHAMSDEIRTLTGHARGVLAALSANDMTLAETAVATGTPIVNDIDTKAHAIREALAGVPLVATGEAAYGVSPAVRERYANDLDAIAATDGVTDDWTRLTVGSISASRLSGLLASHDSAVVGAAERGRAADYVAALDRLDAADTAMKDARGLRDKLVATVDVSTLDAWLDRSAAYDVALRALYTALRQSGGVVTDAVRTAARAEQTAKARLPPDTRALVLIMGEIGRGGMTDSAVAIEQAASDIDEALSPPATETP
jgi:hypothetical protein